MYFAARRAARSLTKQIHTEAQKSKLESRIWLQGRFQKETHGDFWPNQRKIIIIAQDHPGFGRLDDFEGLPGLRMTVVDVIKDLHLEALEDFEPTSLLAY